MGPQITFIVLGVRALPIWGRQMGQIRRAGPLTPGVATCRGSRNCRELFIFDWEMKSVHDQDEGKQSGANLTLDDLRFMSKYRCSTAIHSYSSAKPCCLSIGKKCSDCYVFHIDSSVFCHCSSRWRKGLRCTVFMVLSFSFDFAARKFEKSLSLMWNISLGTVATSQRFGVKAVEHDPC